MAARTVPEGPSVTSYGDTRATEVVGTGRPRRLRTRPEVNGWPSRLFRLRGSRGREPLVTTPPPAVAEPRTARQRRPQGRCAGGAGALISKRSIQQCECAVRVRRTCDLSADVRYKSAT